MFNFAEILSCTFNTVICNITVNRRQVIACFFGVNNFVHNLPLEFLENLFVCFCSSLFDIPKPDRKFFV